MFARWPRRSHEQVVDHLGRLVVRVVVLTDVLAGQLEAVATPGHLVEDGAAGRVGDVMAEVVADDHVLAAPAGERREGAVDDQRLEAGGQRVTG